MNAPKKQKNGNWRLYVIGLIIFALLLGIFALQVSGKNTKKVTSQQVTNADEEAKANDLTVWSIINMTDWLLWPFILITAGGIMFIIYYTLKEHQEKTRAKLLLQGQIKSNDIRGLLRIIEVGNLNRTARLMHQMIMTFNKTKRAEPIGDDINQFLNSERESFETFTRVINFLSDTAGALGLLGTVWGIFQTFHAGKLDGPTILQGMSISLVTTLVGLIISLLLNLGSTYVFTLFNGHLKVISNKAEELRQALLYLENNPSNNQFHAKERPARVNVVENQYQPRQRIHGEETMDVIF